MKPGAVIGVIDHVANPNKRHARDGREIAPHRPRSGEGGFQARRLRAGRQQRHAAQPGRRPQPAGFRPQDPRARPTASSSSSGSRVERKPARSRRRAESRRASALITRWPRWSSAWCRHAAGAAGARRRASALGVAGFVGTLWLNALKMTVIPLVVALLVVGIAKSAEAAQAGGSPAVRCCGS